jgi:predicted ArsR family transcriptional regulator
VTDAPCRAEIAFVEALLGQPLERTEFLLDGGPSCSYQVGG